ncbi:MAG: DUF4115 domain-containing protein [Desulfovibrionaceae bacterium]|nr:DUF4115 domain-containing protein [Desulfovibrionaceae bacterium]
MAEPTPDIREQQNVTPEGSRAEAQAAPAAEAPAGQGGQECQGPYAGVAELGAGLRAAREARGLSQQDVADSLRLSVSVVQALEAGDMEKIRHAAYAKGFLRSYAGLMKMPREWYDGVVRSLSPQAPVVPQEPVYRPDKTARPPRRSPVLGVLVSLMLAIAAVWAVWHFNVIEFLVSEDSTPVKTAVPLQTYETTPLEQRADTAPAPQAQAQPSGMLPDGMQQPAQNPNMPAGAGSSSSVGSPSLVLAPGMPDTNREPLPAVVTPNSPWATLQGNATLAGQAGLATEPAPQVSSANPNLPAGAETLPADGRHSITIIAEAQCWTQVTVDSGRSVQRTLQPGETISVPFENQLVLRLGNAGGVRVLYDGTEQTDRGRMGQVRTMVFPPKPAG